MPPSAIARTLPRVGRTPPRFRPGGAIDPSWIGVILTDLPPGVVVHAGNVGGESPIALGEDNFVTAFSLGTSVRVLSGDEVRSGHLFLRHGPPRLMSYNDLAVTQRIGEAVEPVGRALVDLSGWSAEAEVRVDNRPTPGRRDPRTGIFRFAVPAGWHHIYVAEPEGSSLPYGSRELDLLFEPGDIHGLVPDDLIGVDRRPPLPRIGAYVGDGSDLDGGTFGDGSMTPTPGPTPPPTPPVTTLAPTSAPTPTPTMQSTPGPTALATPRPTSTPAPTRAPSGPLATTGGISTGAKVVAGVVLASLVAVGLWYAVSGGEGEPAGDRDDDRSKGPKKGGARK